MSGKPTSSKASVTPLPSAGEQSEVEAASGSELEQIQDILFGHQSRAFESNLKAMENEFAARLEQMSVAMDTQFEQLNAQLSRQREQINEQIAQTQTELEHNKVSKQQLSQLLSSMASSIEQDQLPEEQTNAKRKSA